MAPWEVVEHTADVGLEATGADLEEALASLLVGFGRLIAPEGTVRGREARTVTVEGEALDDLVIDLLDEVNYLVQTEGFLPASAAVAVDEEAQRLQAILRGETYDPERHGHLMEVKAATYHGLVVEKAPVRVVVIFDI